MDPLAKSFNTGYDVGFRQGKALSDDGYTLAKSVLEYESLYGDVLPDIQAWRDVLSQAKKIVEGVEG